MGSVVPRRLSCGCAYAIYPNVVRFVTRRSVTVAAAVEERGTRRQRSLGVGLPKGRPGTKATPPAATDPQRAWEDETWYPELTGSRRIPAPLQEPFTVLGIETSCDDTAAAVVRSDGKILGEAIISQSDLHEQWGGIVPGVARDAHEEAINQVIAQAVAQAGCDEKNIDAVGVTVGPGLEICLRIGFQAGRDWAVRNGVPFVGVNHLEGHALLARQTSPGLEFPFLVLLVSGGHCQLLFCLGVGDYRLIGGTLDDALGEAYDKTARLLGLNVGGGGGPQLEKLARDGDPKVFALPVPMRHRKDCNLSYAGLKTSVRLATEKARAGDADGPLDRQTAADIAASFQHAALTHLVERTKRAMVLCKDQAPEVRDIVVAGGVAANAELRRRLDEMVTQLEWRLHVPPPRLCTDNGVMIAWAAIERLRLGIADEHKGLAVRARWPLGSEYFVDE